MKKIGPKNYSGSHQPLQNQINPFENQRVALPQLFGLLLVSFPRGLPSFLKTLRKAFTKSRAVG